MRIKKKRLDLEGKKAVTGYLFITPFIVGFLMFMVRPLIESLQMSFSNVKVGTGQGGFVMEYVGVANYKKAFMIEIGRASCRERVLRVV